jgi:hypothetical protein
MNGRCLLVELLVNDSDECMKERDSLVILYLADMWSPKM